jgi:methylmalonyl-CoA mutase
MIRNDLQHIQLDSQNQNKNQRCTNKKLLQLHGWRHWTQAYLFWTRYWKPRSPWFWCWLFSLFTRSLYYYVCASPWTIRQYAGFSTAEESNAFIDVILLQDKRTIDRFFDLTHRGYDSDHERVVVCRKSSCHWHCRGYESIVWSDSLVRNVSFNDHERCCTAHNFYIVAAEEQGVKPEQLSGTIQNDILKEFMVHVHIPPEPPWKSLPIFLNIPVRKCLNLIPYLFITWSRCNSWYWISLHADGLEYIRTDYQQEWKSMSSLHAFLFWAIGMNHFMEIAKMRAGRMIWAKLVKQFNPTD